MKILEVRFKWTNSREEYERKARPGAHMRAGVSGLRWKIYAYDDEGSMATGIYLFEDIESLNSYLGPFKAGAQPEGVEDIEFKVWDVQEALSRITRAPI